MDKTFSPRKMSTKTVWDHLLDSPSVGEAIKQCIRSGKKPPPPLSLPTEIIHSICVLASLAKLADAAVAKHHINTINNWLYPTEEKAKDNIS